MLERPFGAMKGWRGIESPAIGLGVAGEPTNGSAAPPIGSPGIGIAPAPVASAAEPARTTVAARAIRVAFTGSSDPEGDAVAARRALVVAVEVGAHRGRTVAPGGEPGVDSQVPAPGAAGAKEERLATGTSGGQLAVSLEEAAAAADEGRDRDLDLLDGAPLAVRGARAGAAGVARAAVQ